MCSYDHLTLFLTLVSGLEFIRFDLDLVSVLSAALSSGSRGDPGCQRCSVQGAPSCRSSAENLKLPLLGRFWAGVFGIPIALHASEEKRGGGRLGAD